MPERKEWFSADRPIGARTEDKLGRRSFAEALAGSVSGWRGRDSLVIGLYGAWGTGKSSLKNMVLDALQPRQGPEIPIVVEFNPWQFANREQLTEAFFDQIGIALGRGTPGSEKDRRRLLKRWEKYAAYLKQTAGIVEHFRKPLISALTAGAVLVAGTALVQIRTVGLMVSVFLAVLAALLQWSSKFAELMSGLFGARVDTGRRTLEEIKSELSEALRALKAPLMVVVDDVDRLIPAEVQELFQLIKVNADFPNLVYLLLFDRTVVEKNIEKMLAVSGRDYLEKIVQVGFDVPAIERARLHKILFDGLDQLVSESAVSKRFDRQRWGNLFWGGLRGNFRTLRDVNRFLSTFAFHVSLFRCGSSFEVNPVDLIGLEVLRVFHPGVYHSIAAEKELLTGRLDRDERSDEKRKAVAGIVNEAEEESRSTVREIIKQLFPPVEWALDGSGYGKGFDDTWYRELRVCSQDVFDRYFNLTIAENDISQATMERILGATGDRDGLRAELFTLKERGLLPVALDRLEAYKEQIPLEHAESFITALFDVCDSLPHTASGMFEIAPMMHADRIIYWYLRREPDAARKRQALEASIKATGGLSLPVDLVSLESQRGGEEQRRDENLVDGDGVSALKSLCVEKIEAAASSGQLVEFGDLATILYRWRDWAGDGGPKAFIRELVRSSTGAVKFLKAFLSRSTSHGMDDYVAREHWYIALGGIETFVPWETVEAVMKDVSLESLPSDEDRRAVEAFGRAVRRRRQGRPDFGTGFDFGDDDE